MADLKWQNDIDVAALSQSQQTSYAAYQAAYKAAKAARERFEATMQEGVPAGKVLICNYRFGKLSVALSDGTPKPSSNGKAKISLADFLAQQAAQGR